MGGIHRYPPGGGYGKQLKDDYRRYYGATIGFSGRGEVFSPMPTAEQGYGLATGGTIIHELGGTRMGNDPGTSVLNRWCQAHDCKNLFVTDGGPFVSQADKNPTWTILALSMRTSDSIADQMKRRAL